MKFTESQSIELKLEYTEEIKRTVIAFVNGEGGVVAKRGGKELVRQYFAQS